MKRVSQLKLTKFIADLFHSAGMPARDAREIAGVFVLQEMRGNRTHGLRRIARNLQSVVAGEMNARPKRKVLSNAGGTVVIDGENGIGMLGSMAAMEQAIRKARRQGIGIGIVINSNHFLAAAPYCIRAAEAGMIGLAFSNTYASMGYPGTHKRVIGNGPHGFAAPTAAGYPMVFDAALSTSYGKLMQWVKEGKAIPTQFYGLDSKGRPTQNPQQVVEGGTPVPIGEHKGAGLVLLIEVLTGVLGGGAFLSQIQAPERRKSKRNAESQCCIAIDIAHFMPVPTFKRRLAALITDLKRSPLAPGATAITVPGERAGRCLRESVRRGVIVDADVADELRSLGTQRGVAVPF